MPEAWYLWPEKIGTYLDGTEPRHSDPLDLTQLLIAYPMIRAEQADD